MSFEIPYPKGSIAIKLIERLVHLDEETWTLWTVEPGQAVHFCLPLSVIWNL